LVVEDAAEVIAIGEHVGLQRQKRPAGIHQVDARQVILGGDLLRAQMFLHRHRVVRTALDGGVVGHDRARRAVDDPDSGDDPGRRRVIVVHPVRGEGREFEERGAGVDEPVDPFACGEFAALVMTLGRRRAAARPHARQVRA